MMTLADALAMLPGAALVGDPAVRVQRVHTDTRTLQPGDLFVALRGDRFDAHDFLPAARTAGAAAAIAERGLAEAGLPGLQVADSLRALQQLAAAWRRRHAALQLVAVTGSNGKTTVTQMIAAILRVAFGDAAFWTRGNLNNHIGLPLTLLAARDRHHVGVVELGMNHPGEIALLAGLAAPRWVLVNNAQREHQEFMHGVEAVARENGSAIGFLPPDGGVVIPADDACVPIWRELAGARPVRTFALDAAADVRGQAQWAGDAWSLGIEAPEGRVQARVRIAGRHNAKNALAAAACALWAGAPLQAVADGLAAFEPVAGRSRTLAITLHGRAATLVDDAYNANPDSVLAAIDVLAALPGPRWLVLGDMGEVGDQGPAYHAEVGRQAAARGIEAVWTVGEATAHTAAACGARHFPTLDALIGALAESPAAASVLVKGSRFMQMPRLVRALVESVGDAAGPADGASAAPAPGVPATRG